MCLVLPSFCRCMAGQDQELQDALGKDQRRAEAGEPITTQPKRAADNLEFACPRRAHCLLDRWYTWGGIAGITASLCRVQVGQPL